MRAVRGIATTVYPPLTALTIVQDRAGVSKIPSQAVTTLVIARFNAPAVTTIAGVVSASTTTAILSAQVL